MCFSTPVSFATGALLTVVGVASVRKTLFQGELFLASIPFLFAVQQIVEGFQWLAVKQGGTSLILGYIFLFFAFVIWPAYLPIAVYKIENNKKNKIILRLFIISGFIVAAWLLFVILKNPLDIYSYSQSIQYLIPIPMYMKELYAVVVVGCLFASSSLYIRWYGCAIAVSFLITNFFFNATLISTWCFSAAILSFILYFYFVNNSKLDKNSIR